MKIGIFRLATCYLCKVVADAKTAEKTELMSGDSESNNMNEYLVTRATSKDTFSPEKTRQMILENGLAIVRETTTYFNPQEAAAVPGSVLASLDKVAFAPERFNAPNKFIPKPDFNYMEGYNKMVKKSNQQTSDKKKGAKNGKPAKKPENAKADDAEEKDKEKSEGEEPAADKGQAGQPEQGEGEGDKAKDEDKDKNAEKTDKAGFFPGGSFMRPSFGKYSSLV